LDLLTELLFPFYSLKNKFMANQKPSRRNFIKQVAGAAAAIAASPLA
jgi:hypothetical protein